jgi:Competence protein J (ComJ)
MIRGTSMRGDTAVFSARIYFSYSQFFVFNKSVKLPGCAWTERHYQQGFARREMNVCFGTPLEFGHADISVHLGPYKSSDEHQRVIEVPIEVSGKIVIAGPEEIESKNVIKLAKGTYRLVAGQTVTGDDQETVDLYFEKLISPITKSRILVCDEALHPLSKLLENAEVA